MIKDGRLWPEHNDEFTIEQFTERGKNWVIIFGERLLDIDNKYYTFDINDNPVKLKCMLIPNEEEISVETE